MKKLSKLLALASMGLMLTACKLPAPEKVFPFLYDDAGQTGGETEGGSGNTNTGAAAAKMTGYFSSNKKVVWNNMLKVTEGEGYNYYFMVITDYSSNSNYTSHVNGLAAGSDIWDGIGNTETNTPFLSAFKNDAYVCQLMRQSTHRILFVQVNSSAMNGISATDKIVPILTWWQKSIMSVDIVLGTLTLACTAGLVYTIIKNKKEA